MISTPITDTSISDDDRIVISDISKKISRLDLYIERVHQRMRAINLSKKNAQQKTTEFFEKKTNSHSVKVKK